MQKFIFEHPWILIIILLWTLPWKGAALWRSARRGHLGWFLTLLIFNTLGILDILYFFIFSSPKSKEKEIVSEVRQPRIQSFQAEELKQKQLMEKQRQMQELEEKQARYAAESKKRINIL